MIHLEGIQVPIRPHIQTVIHDRRTGFYRFLEIDALKNLKFIGCIDNNQHARLRRDEDLIIDADG